MGSCRVCNPCGLDHDCVHYPGGFVYSTTDILQAFEVMSGNIEIPDPICKAKFRGNPIRVFDGVGVKPKKTLDWESFDTIVFEVSSNRSYRVIKRSADFYLPYGTLTMYTHRRSKLLDVIAKEARLSLEIEDRATIERNLHRLGEIVGDRKIIACVHHNLVCHTNRYLISHVVSSWCREESHAFFDPTPVIAACGPREVFRINRRKRIDYDHYSEPGWKIVNRRLMKLIRGD